MKQPLQITLSNTSSEPGRTSPQGPLSRLKTVAAALIVTVIALAILVAGFLLGSLLAACLFLGFAIVSVVILLKTTVRRLRN